MVRASLLLAASVIAAPAALAQAGSSNPLYLSAGAAFAETAGFELELGWEADWNDTVHVRFSPANLVIFGGDDPEGFHRETFSNGNTICRNEANGQFSDEQNCAPEYDAEWRAAGELQFRMAPNTLIGAGALYVIQGDLGPEDERVLPYGVVTFNFNERYGAEIRGGSDYVALQLRLSL